MDSRAFHAFGHGVVLAGEEAGEGLPVVLLHGLTATRRYVVMGSRSLERSGHRVLAYDARGHGESPLGQESYSYAALADDLGAVLDECGVERAVLAGASMGAHTLLRFALDHPERAAGLVVITPAFDGKPVDVDGRLERWDRLAAGLRSGGIDGFLAAYDFSAIDPALRKTVATVIRQRLALHRRLPDIARALEEVPRSRPFAALCDRQALGGTPTAVVASNDRADPEHPQWVGEAYAAAIPGARLVLDPPGDPDGPPVSPIAWQGSRLSRVIAEVAALAQR
jgi:pimeloyl-ACP methyl ester carboxylesterase